MDENEDVCALENANASKAHSITDDGGAKYGGRSIFAENARGGASREPPRGASSEVSAAYCRASSLCRNAAMSARATLAYGRNSFLPPPTSQPLEMPVSASHMTSR